MGRTYRIEFPDSEKVVCVPEGTLLSQGEELAGVREEFPCGGKGLCGKCKRIIEEDGKRREVLACQTEVTGDWKVWIPGEKEKLQILTSGKTRTVSPDSSISVISVQVNPIQPGEPDSVLERVEQAVESVRGTAAGSLRAGARVLGSLYAALRKSGGQGFAVLDGRELLDFTEECPRVYLMAVDIGTTTLAGYLIRQDTGEICSRVSSRNPQAEYGADVISRAHYTLEHGMEEMTACIRKAVRELIRHAAGEAGISPRQIYLVGIAGNTCMHHLYAGISPEALVTAPYSPVIRRTMELEEEQVQAGIHPSGKIRLLPNIAGFVGADTSACLLASEFDLVQDTTLLLDIGTNGEMVLGDGTRAVTCSTAAGPAFEGARITCGMRGAAGAIDHVWSSDEPGENRGAQITENHTVYRLPGGIQYSVIGQGPPLGICGSGLLDAAAVLLDCGVLGTVGLFEDPDGREVFSSAGEEDGGRRFYFYRGDSPSESVYLTQKDICELQLGKASIAAGIRVLCDKLGILPGDIHQILIAGAFGTYMDPDSACRIGLLPRISSGQITMLGNAAGEGACIAVSSQREWERCERMAKWPVFVELAAEKTFSDYYVEEMEFPEGKQR